MDLFSDDRTLEVENDQNKKDKKNFRILKKRDYKIHCKIINNIYHANASRLYSPRPSPQQR